MIFDAVLAAAQEALDLIRARNTKEVTRAATSNECIHGEASEPRDDQMCADCDTRHGSDAETDPQLEAVLSKTEEVKLSKYQTSQVWLRYSNDGPVQVHVRVFQDSFMGF